MSNVPADLKFMKSHEWVRAEGDGRFPSASATTRRLRWAT